MDFSHIKAIIFDAEGVVVNTEMLWDKSQILLLDRRGLRYDREYLKPKMAGKTLLEGARLMVDYYNLCEEANIIAQERKELIHRLFENEIHFIDGFERFVDSLCKGRLRISIATAMNRDLMLKVEKKLNLKKYFGKHIYFIEDVGNKSKPAPDVFLLAAEKTGVGPSDCAVIEDAPHGIRAANKAGMISIGLTTTFSREVLSEADYIVDSFEELLNVFKLGQMNF